ncbi:hypothetical protein [Alkalimarinus alittae]|uniref:Uncharacterized protein n=1 Tax=Alkalimarinus alittae TaxID=2961619 RepID=A0ABY6MXJ9_9ALTE|nr:hypothetical protein [Alkalimarinus alittae]UZE94553.1 hypothetical protein NKI27_10685 [Alkalimarinus alittae]
MEDWNISIKQQLVTHSSGSTFKFNGQPGSTDYGISPSFKSKNLSVLEQAQLIRIASNLYQDAVKKGRSLNTADNVA